MKMKIIITVAIVLILLAFLLPQIDRPVPAYENATIRRMRALDAALTLYAAEYRRLPEGNTSNILAILGGTPVDAQNPRKIIFMELQPQHRRHFWESPVGDVDTNGEYLDAWNRPFQITITSDEWAIRSMGGDARLNTDDDLIVTNGMKSDK